MSHYKSVGTVIKERIPGHLEHRLTLTWLKGIFIPLCQCSCGEAIVVTKEDLDGCET